MHPPATELTPLMPNLFELLPFYVQIFLLVVTFLMLAVALGFIIRVARTALKAAREADSGQLEPRDRD